MTPEADGFVIGTADKVTVVTVVAPVELDDFGMRVFSETLEASVTATGTDTVGTTAGDGVAIGVDIGGGTTTTTAVSTGVALDDSCFTSGACAFRLTSSTAAFDSFTSTLQGSSGSATDAALGPASTDDSAPTLSDAAKGDEGTAALISSAVSSRRGASGGVRVTT